MKRFKIISGGQTGVDQLALVRARDAGLPTGGTAPKGFVTEHGAYRELGTIFGLVEHSSPNYPPRTTENIKAAHLTVIFTSNPKDTAVSLCAQKGGSALTAKTCAKLGKPYLVNPQVPEILLAASAACAEDTCVINIAGPRLSRVSTDRMLELETILDDLFAQLVR